MENVWKGTTVKIAVSISGTPNVKLTDCEYNVQVWASSSSNPIQEKPATGVVRRAKADTVEIDAYSCAVEVPTATIGKGYVIARIECQVPDTDCAGGWRNEVYQMETGLKVV